MQTAFTRLVGCRLPIRLAVVGGGVGTPARANAVTAAGGPGMVASTHLQPVAEQLAAVAHPVGVGFLGFDVTRHDDAFDAALIAASRGDCAHHCVR